MHKKSINTLVEVGKFSSAARLIPDIGDGTIIYLVGLAGDFDLDFDVDGGDFLIWQRGFGTTHNAGDLDDWQVNFGAVDLLPASSAVPEASTLLLAVIGLPVVLARRRIRCTEFA